MGPRIDDDEGQEGDEERSTMVGNYGLTMANRSVNQDMDEGERR